MRIFLNEHPFISLIMVGIVCTAAVEAVDIYTNGKKTKKIGFPFLNKKETQEEVKSEE